MNRYSAALNDLKTHPLQFLKRASFKLLLIPVRWKQLIVRRLAFRKYNREFRDWQNRSDAQPRKKHRLSAVIVSKNDNYGGDLVRRAAHCLNAMTETFDEVLYVDWASDGETLVDAIGPDLAPTGKLKLIEVDKEMARRLISQVERNPFNCDEESVQTCIEVLGRNIAIRRADGDFVVATNIDIIPPNREQIDFFIETKHGENMCSIFDRFNVSLNNYPQFGIAEFEELRKHLNSKLSTLMSQNKLFRNDRYWVFVGDFQLARKTIWEEIRGFEEAMIYRGNADYHVIDKMEALEKTYQVTMHFPVFHLDHQRSPAGDSKNNNLEYYRTEHRVTKNRPDWGYSNIEFPVRIF